MIVAVSIVYNCQLKSLSIILVWDIWDKDRKPKRATLKHGSIYDYYDILEEIGR